jgi:hypothetical protein
MTLQELKSDFQQHRIETKNAFRNFMNDKTKKNMELYHDARDARNDCLILIKMY